MPTLFTLWHSARVFQKIPHLGTHVAIGMPMWARNGKYEKHVLVNASIAIRINSDLVYD